MNMFRPGCLKSNIAASSRSDLPRRVFRPSLPWQRLSPQHHCRSPGQRRWFSDPPNPLLTKALRSAADRLASGWRWKIEVVRQCPELWPLIMADVEKNRLLIRSASASIFSSREDFVLAGWQSFRQLSDIVSNDAEKAQPVLTAQQRMVLENNLERAVQSVADLMYITTWMNRVFRATFLGLFIYWFRYTLGIVSRPEHTNVGAE